MSESNHFQNIGLQAKILSPRTFTMFVVMALVTTVSTTPLTSFLYPPAYQKKLEAWKRGEIDWDGNRLLPEVDTEHDLEKLQSTNVRRLLVYLRLDSLPSLFTFINLLGADGSTVTKRHKTKEEFASSVEGLSSTLEKMRPLEVHGVRILELTERTSSVMKVAEADEYTFRDPVVNTFRTFAQLNNVAVSGGVSIVPESSYAETLTGRAADISSDLVLIPWSENGSIAEGDSTLILSDSCSQDRYSSGSYNLFIQEALDKAVCNTAVFVNRGFGGSSIPERPLQKTISSLSLRSHRQAQLRPIADRSHHVFFPFFGGSDDQVALRFVLQLAQSSNITATILHILPSIPSTVGASSKGPAVTSAPTDQKITTTSQVHDVAFLHNLRDSLPEALASRVVFSDHATSDPLSTCLDHAKQEVGQSPRNAGDLIVIGRGKNLTSFLADVDLSSSQLSYGANLEVRNSLGLLAEAVIMGGVKASVLVMQAADQALDT